MDKGKFSVLFYKSLILAEIVILPLIVYVIWRRDGNSAMMRGSELNLLLFLVLPALISTAFQLRGSVTGSSIFKNIKSRLIAGREDQKELLKDEKVLELEQSFCAGVRKFAKRRISGLMTHRTDLVWLRLEDDIETIRKRVRSEPHSVYPVADADLDHFVGIVSLKDLFSVETTGTFRLRELVKTPLLVMENLSALRVLETFNKTGIHHAMVVSEHGAIEGMITMDDLMEALIGNQIERKKNEPGIFQKDETHWIALGKLSYYEFLTYFNLPDSKRAVAFNTVGGLIIDILQDIPAVGEKVEYQNLVLEVIAMDGHRIQNVMISKAGNLEKVAELF